MKTVCILNSLQLFLLHRRYFCTCTMQAKSDCFTRLALSRSGMVEYALAKTYDIELKKC
jgi:hypothetical protein